MVNYTGLFISNDFNKPSLSVFHHKYCFMWEIIILVT